MSIKKETQELLHIRTRSQSRSLIGESTNSSCTAASWSLATVSEFVVTTTATRPTPNPNSVTTENIKRNNTTPVLKYVFH